MAPPRLKVTCELWSAKTTPTTASDTCGSGGLISVRGSEGGRLVTEGRGVVHQVAVAEGGMRTPQDRRKNEGRREWGRNGRLTEKERERRETKKRKKSRRSKRVRFKETKKENGSGNRKGC